MAHHLRAILGPMLLDQPLDGVTTRLPSPEVQSGCPEGGEAKPAWGPTWGLDQSALRPQELKGKILLKGKKLGGLLPAGGENGPEATDVSDEDEAAEMEDEAVRSQVQHKAKVLGEAVGVGRPRPFPPHCPRDGCLALGFLWPPFRPSAPPLSVSVSSLSLPCPSFSLLSGFLVLRPRLVLPYLWL